MPAHHTLQDALDAYLKAAGRAGVNGGEIWERPAE
jgi:hypothetical protein